MTVIAWDGKTLAADKRAIPGGGICHVTTKIQRHSNSLLAITGSWDVGCEMREWWKSGAEPEKFPAKAREDTATLIVFRADAILIFNSGPYPMPLELKQCAFGSGRDFATAAMHLGCNSERAVEVACKFQSDCGNGIDTLELE